MVKVVNDRAVLQAIRQRSTHIKENARLVFTLLLPCCSATFAVRACTARLTAYTTLLCSSVELGASESAICLQHAVHEGSAGAAGARSEASSTDAEAFQEVHRREDSQGVFPAAPLDIAEQFSLDCIEL